LDTFHPDTLYTALRRSNLEIFLTFQYPEEIVSRDSAVGMTTTYELDYLRV
jgi:hypothetical protein